MRYWGLSREFWIGAGLAAFAIGIGLLVALVAMPALLKTVLILFGCALMLGGLALMGYFAVVVEDSPLPARTASPRKKGVLIFDANEQPYIAPVRARRIHGATVIAGVVILAVVTGIWMYNRSLPNVIITKYEVPAFKADQEPYVNIHFQNIGGDGRIMLYINDRLAPTATDPRIIKKGMERGTQALIAAGNGLPYVIQANEGKWFTISSRKLTEQQVQDLEAGKLAFYFTATIVNGHSGKDYDLCGFVVGNNPRAILSCPTD